jgi:hypothetical protein
MNSRILLFLWIVFTLGCAHFSQQKSPEEFYPCGEQTSLFDGQKLGYWKKSDFVHPGKIEVVDSAIILGMGGYMTGITWDGPLVRINYEINLDAKRIEGDDFFCGLTFPYGETVCSFIAGGWGGVTTGLSNIDEEDASENETSNWMYFNQNQWYHIRLRVTPEKIDVWINDRHMVELETAGKRINIRSEMSDCVPLGIATYWTKAAIKNLTLEWLQVPSR